MHVPRFAFAVVVLGALGVVPWTPLALANGKRPAPVAARRELRPVPLVVVEAEGDETRSRVLSYAFTEGAKPRLLGVVPHVAGSAKRGALATSTPLRAFVIVQERESRGASSYGSALYRVQEGTEPKRLRGGLTDASRPVVTDRGTVLVQAGTDGVAPPAGAPHELRERVDELSVEAVDPEKGTSRAVWRGRGMIAFLATALPADEVVVYHVHETGAALFVLHAGSGRTRALVEDLEPTARDFSFDPSTDTIVFARVARDRGGYEVVSLPAHGPARRSADLQVRLRTASDRTSPVALLDGSIALSMPGERGLGWLGRADGTPLRDAPLGDGSDEVMASHGAALAVRHRTRSEEFTVVYDRTTRRVYRVGEPSHEIDVLGFAEGTRP